MGYVIDFNVMVAAATVLVAAAIAISQCAMSHFDLAYARIARNQSERRAGAARRSTKKEDAR